MLADGELLGGKDRRRFRPEIPGTSASRVGMALRAISLLSTNAMTSLTPRVRMSLEPKVSRLMSESAMPLSNVSRIM